MLSIWEINAREGIDSKHSISVPRFFVTINEMNHTVIGDSMTANNDRIESAVKFQAMRVMNSRQEARAYIIEVKRKGAWDR